MHRMTRIAKRIGITFTCCGLVGSVNAQIIGLEGSYEGPNALDVISPLPARSIETDLEALRLMRNDKLDLVLPGAMRDNGVDMWIHVARGNNPMYMQFGLLSGYLIFTDTGDKIERAHFGGSPGAVENIDVHGSESVARAFAGYNYDNSDPDQGYSVPEVFDEISRFIEERDPDVIAVNYSDFMPVADGISHSQFLRLQTILGPKYSQRVISAENVINDFLVRRTSREVAAQVELLTLARQDTLQNIRAIVPGVTTADEADAAVVFSTVSTPEESRSPGYVLQPGDLFYTGSNGGGTYMGMDVDTKTYVYILRDGESAPPGFLQEAYDKAVAGQKIMRPHMRVGMTGGESFAAMVEAMEAEGYIHTPFTDRGEWDDERAKQRLKDTFDPGFSIDNHSMINNRIETGEVEVDIRTEGPSMGPFRKFTHHRKIQENHLFAFEYMTHMQLKGRPGPWGRWIFFNFSNPQIVTSKGVENIQVPNEAMVLIRE